jgi:hypothetical protein
MPNDCTHTLLCLTDDDFEATDKTPALAIDSKLLATQKETAFQIGYMQED